MLALSVLLITSKSDLTLGSSNLAPALNVPWSWDFWCLCVRYSLCPDHLTLHSKSCLLSPLSLCIFVRIQVKYLLFFDAFLLPAGRTSGSFYCVPIVLWGPWAMVLTTLCVGGLFPVSGTQWHLGFPFVLNWDYLQETVQILLCSSSSFHYQAQKGIC